jgi:acetyltransferase-like isoleucine patch superfamily enzyme
VTDFLTPDDLRSLGVAQVGRNVKVDATVRIYGANRLRLGDDIRIDAYSVISCGADGIVIGNRVHLGAFVFLAGAARIELGDFSGLSGRTSIYSSNDDYLGDALTGPTVPDELRKVTSAPVVVGRHAIVGAGSILLPGVTVGTGAAVGSLSLVNRDVDELAIVAGTPARRIGDRKPDFLALEAKVAP